jgi:Stress responsive A/B Barrel Domain
MYKHFVLLKIKENHTQHEVNKIFSILGELKNEVPGMMLMSYGKNLSEYHDSYGFTHAFSVDFIDKEFYRLYQQNPKYNHLLSHIHSVIHENGMIVFDYPLDFT